MKQPTAADRVPSNTLRPEVAPAGIGRTRRLSCCLLSASGYSLYQVRPARSGGGPKAQRARPAILRIATTNNPTIDYLVPAVAAAQSSRPHSGLRGDSDGPKKCELLGRTVYFRAGYNYPAANSAMRQYCRPCGVARHPNRGLYSE